MLLLRLATPAQTPTDKRTNSLVRHVFFKRGNLLICFEIERIHCPLLVSLESSVVFLKLVYGVLRLLFERGHLIVALRLQFLVFGLPARRIYRISAIGGLSQRLCFRGLAYEFSFSVLSFI